MSEYTLASRVVPRLPFSGDPALRLVQRNLTAARRYWLVLVSGFFEPLFYLLGLGIGFGALVGDH